MDKMDKMQEIKEKMWDLAEEAMDWQALYSQVTSEKAQENIATQASCKIGDMIEEICDMINKIN
jgi:hypothetical protein